MSTVEAGKNGGMVRPPEGFRRVGSVTNAPWFFMKKGNVLHGKILNIYERPDDRVAKNADGSPGKSKFFQVELLEACEVRDGTGEAAKVIKAVPGQVVNLNYTVKTRDIEPFVPQVIRGAEINVWALVGEKMKIKGGKQTMWDVQCHIDIAKPALATDEVAFGSAPAAA